MTDYQVLWRATNILGDYFSRLGGANRYTGMYESEVFLFVACSALDIAEDDDYVSRYVSPQFLSAAAAVIPDVRHELKVFQRQDISAHDVILEYVLYYDAKLKNERCPRWHAFYEEISSGGEAGRPAG